MSRAVMYILNMVVDRRGMSSTLMVQWKGNDKLLRHIEVCHYTIDLTAPENP